MTLAGAAYRIINNELGTHIQGATTHKLAESILDDLEANALYLADGEEQALLIGCDVGALEGECTREYQRLIEKACGVPAGNVLIACSHTHSGPSVLPTCYSKPLDGAYLDRLGGWLAEVAEEAVTNAVPARIAVGQGRAPVGYNRRCCWLDGSHTMHGDGYGRDDFTGLEGPDDPAHLAVFAEDLEGRLLAAFHHNTSHPTTYYGANFYSADFPGYARARIRETLGDLPVVFMNGCQGDIAMHCQVVPRPNGENSKQKLARAGCQLAGETLRLLHEAEFLEDVPVAHLGGSVRIPVRLPDEERLARSRELLAEVDAGAEKGGMEVVSAHGAVMLQERFGENPVDEVELHAVRIGDAALLSHPAELYCQFGLDIKRRSPAPVTAVAGVTGAYAGYVPTVYGIMGGGYSGETIYWCRLVPEGGYLLVDAAARLLNELWRK